MGLGNWGRLVSITKTVVMGRGGTSWVERIDRFSYRHPKSMMLMEHISENAQQEVGHLVRNPGKRPVMATHTSNLAECTAEEGFESSPKSALLLSVCDSTAGVQRPHSSSKE